MTRTSLKDENCSWAQGAEIIGDRWNILILRDAMKGVNTFSGFEQKIGLSKKVLTQRLEALQENGILQKTPSGPNSKRCNYALTEKGRGLFPVIIALGQWGDKWVFGPGNEPVVIVEKESGLPLDEVQISGGGKQNLSLSDVDLLSQPVATDHKQEVSGT